MLNKFRDQTQSIGFKVIVGLLVVVLAVFGFGGFNLFAPTDPTVASVNGTEISQRELEVEAQRQLQQLAAQFGENFDPDLIDPATLQGQALNRLVTQELLSQAARSMNLGVADDAVTQALRDNPNFQLDGSFDETTYRRTVGLLGYSPKEFLATLRRNMTLDRYTDSFMGTTVLPGWELQEAARFLAQQRSIATLSFTPEHFEQRVSVTDEEVELHYADHRDQYLTDYSVDVEYVQLTTEQLLDDPSIEIVEADIEAQFARELEEAEATAEQRDSSHILLQINEDRSEAEALLEISALRKQLEEGADFEELAQARSEDPGSKLQGGSLGPVGKGIFDPAFEAALWALEAEGDLSPAVKSSFGYHIIRLDGIQRSPLPTLDERREAIVASLRAQAAQTLLAERERELDSLAFESRDSLEPLTNAMALTIQQQTGVTETTGAGPFADPTLRSAMFSTEVLDDGDNTPAVALADGSIVVARVIAREPPAELPLEAVAEGIKAELLRTKAESALIEAHAEALVRLNDGDAVDSVASAYDLSWEVTASVKQSDSGKVSAPVLQAAFLAPAPAPAGKTITEADLPGGGRAVITVTDVRTGDYNALTEAEQEQLRRVVLNRTEQLDFLSLYRSVEDAADVNRPSIASSG